MAAASIDAAATASAATEFFHMAAVSNLGVDTEAWEELFAMWTALAFVLRHGICLERHPSTRHHCRQPAQHRPTRC
jgi:hypothetical protein